MLQKALETPTTGALANHHVIVSYTADLANSRSVVVVNSYFNEAAHAAGRQAMHTWHVQLYEVPPVTQPALPWFEQMLATDEVPTEGDPSWSMSPDRWVFSGAQVL